MLRTVKPKNARSKRALEARAPKEVEDPRTAIFVKGTHVGEVAAAAMKELMALKRPDAISFAKKNAIRPFEDASSLEFFAQKNDASFLVMGQSTKKRPNGLTFIRTFDGRVLDMVEVGVDKFVSMAEFPTPKCTPGHKPLLHFASDLFDTHPRLSQIKSMLTSLFAPATDAIHLKGLEHVISVSLGPTPASLSSTGTSAGTLGATTIDTPAEKLPPVHIRVYTVKLLSSGTRVPRVELVPMGPSLDLSLRRHTDPDPELLKAALKKPKMAKTDVAKGLGKKRKNMEVDEMGDLRGRVHVAKQDLGKLQTRKMKGLKKGFMAEEEASGLEDEEMAEDAGESGTKRRRRA